MKKSIALGVIFFSALMLSACSNSSSKSTNEKSNSMSEVKNNSKSSSVQKVSSDPEEQSSSEDNSSSESSSSDTNTKSSELDFTRITDGNFNGLSYNWQEVAVAGTGLHGGQGLQWSQDPADLTNHLNIRDDQISDGSIRLDKIGIEQDGNDLDVVYSEQHGVLTAAIKDDEVEDAVHNATVKFYPKDVSIDSQFNNGVKDDTSTDRIVFWTSNNSYTEIFAHK